MAIVVGAGPPPANEQAADIGRTPPFEIRKIEIADVIECIAKGVQDFGRAPQYGMFFGAIYAIGGLLIVWAAFALDYPYLAYPFVMGFALFAPFGAAGTYEISRRLESGEPLSWSAILGSVWSRTGKELGWLALVSLFTLIIWLDLAVFVFLMFYGADIPSHAAVVRQNLHHPLRSGVPSGRQRAGGDHCSPRLFDHRRRPASRRRSRGRIS